MVSRRNVLFAFVCAATCDFISSISNAQPRKPLRLGLVLIPPRAMSAMHAFDKRMSELGYIEGKNFTFEFINLNGDVTRIFEAMKEVADRKVDVMLALGPEIALKSALAATSEIPIVVAAIDYDPLALGYVKNIARPTRNFTGIYFQQTEMAGKRLELARLMFPDLKFVAALWDKPSSDQWEATKQAASKLGIEVLGIELSDQPYDYESALAKIPPEYRRALLVMTSPVLFATRSQLCQILLQHRIPGIFVFREWVDTGGLISYGTSITSLFSRAADFVDRVAGGARPSDLPIEQPTKFELVINLKTAKAIGIDMPDSLLARADSVLD